MSDDKMAGRLNELVSLEHPTIKVPYEVLNKKFRAAQKTLDRDVAQVTAVAGELDASLRRHHHQHQQQQHQSNEDDDQALPHKETSATPTSVASAADVRRIITTMSEKLSALKRKSSEAIADEAGAAELCKRRLLHLMQYGSVRPGVVAQWRRQRLCRLLAEHLVRAGCHQLAVQLAEQARVTHLTNIDVFLAAKQVTDSLLRHETGTALAWCHEHKSKLRKNKSKLELALRQQEFIELVKADRRMEAVLHARKYLANMDEYQCEDIQACMALLAFPADTDIEPYRSLLSEHRWTRLICDFRDDNHRIFQLSPVSVFTTVLQDGLSALKTHECYRSGGGGGLVGDGAGALAGHCPVCEPVCRELAASLPYGHCTQSRLRCAVDGRPIDEHNPPLMMPNGSVYGKLALESMSRELNSRVVCPRTQEVFSESQLEKVFVM